MRMSAAFTAARILDTGSCRASEHHLISGGSRRRVDVHSLVALLQHPERGWLLWDTGYAPRVFDATRRWPYRIYRWVTPMRVSAKQTVVAQLPHLGLEPGNIHTVVLSHLHPDHVSGLMDFQEAEWVVTASAWRAVAQRKGARALLKAFVPGLLPPDFGSRARLLDDDAFTGPVLDPFGPTHDLFGDGSALLVPLPGHAHGQLGLLATTVHGRMFLVGDACWTSQSYRERRTPGSVTRIITDDWNLVADTIDRLHRFWLANPDVAIVPAHCPEAYRRHVGQGSA
ncbi:MAG: hypothetical protein QOE68_2977 [Thermoanaerobaculia bacterium]|jgi:glyoxylase-like metal-dependent hydrolase (beta-lactamase superfamily II)|nr:hypothetical protein [Thermoanaerobaculia bacterium]